MTRQLPIRCRPWCRPLVVAAGIALSSCALPDARAPAHLVLVTVDTWRGDHLLRLRGGTRLTPELERWAPRGVRFSAHSSTGTETSPGMASIFTGLLPRHSGVLTNPHVLQGHLPTLAALAAGQGMATAGFVANLVLGPGTGFERGFSHYQVVGPRPPASKARAEEVVDQALDWLDRRTTGERFFLWLHLMEPHGPYESPAAARERFPLEAFGPERRVRLLAPGNNSGWQGIPYYQRQGSGATGEDPREYERCYAAEVLSVDAALGRLLDQLERRRLLADALVILTADHGEALAGDHGFYFSHGHDLTEDQIHVPLLVWGPGLKPGERAYATSSVDLLPTALALLGIPAGGLDLDGKNLFADTPRVVFGERPRERMARRGAWKLRWMRHSPPALYDLGRDPRESEDLSGSDRAEVVELLRALRRSRRPPLASPVNRAPRSREEMAQLRALGYL